MKKRKQSAPDKSEEPDDAELRRIWRLIDSPKKKQELLDLARDMAAHGDKLH